MAPAAPPPLLLSTSPMLKLYSTFLPQASPRSAPPAFLNQIALGVVFLTLARNVWWYLVLAPNGWAWDDDGNFALSCLTAIAFSGLLLLPLLHQLLTHPTRRPCARISDSSPRWNYVSSCVVAYCCAYMLQDGFHTLNKAYIPNPSSIGVMALTDDDVMFLLHHAITLAYMGTARYLGAGHYSCMLLMFFGEVTNPIHNTFLTTEKASLLHPGPRVELIKLASGKIFALLYGVVRLAVGPLLGAWITYDLLFTKRGRENVPVLVSFVWCAATFGVLHGSFGYAMTVCWDELFA